jgi:hypothetical protein
MAIQSNFINYFPFLEHHLEHQQKKRIRYYGKIHPKKLFHIFLIF